MKENAYGIKMLEGITGVCITRYDPENQAVKTDHTVMKELYQDKTLCQKLMDAKKNYQIPQLYEEESIILYVSFEYEKEFFFIGPVSTERLTFARKHAFFKRHRLNVQNETGIPIVKFQKFLEICLLYFQFITGEEMKLAELSNRNEEIRQFNEKEISITEQELEYDDYIMHHSYESEEKIINAIQNCDRELAFSLIEEIIPYMGKMSSKNRNQLTRIFISVVTMTTRICIKNSVQPSKAYAVSDKYLQRLDELESEADIYSLLFRALDHFISLMEERQKEKMVNHVEKCKVYIDTNYRKKLSLKEIAEEIHLNPSYLSHLFSETEGISIKEYICKVRVERAMNLLRFSNSSIVEVGEYVGYESQSYFGKIFKRYTGMTPQMCRDRYQAIEITKKEVTF